MDGNEAHLRASVSAMVKAVQGFAHATGCPAGSNVFDWAREKHEQVLEMERAERAAAKAAGLCPSCGASVSGGDDQ